MADKKISQLTAASQVNSDAVFPLSQLVSGDDATLKATVGQVGNYIADEQTHAGLHTTAKDLIGAINEIAAGGSVETFWNKFDEVIRITANSMQADNYNIALANLRNYSFSGVPIGVKNIIMHTYNQNMVVMFLLEGEEIIYNANGGDAPYKPCYRTNAFNPRSSTSGTVAVSYNTSISGNYIGRNPSWNTMGMNTCDIYDANGVLVFPKNCDLTDFNYST